jgi:NADH-quinone oxidoreductase subunit J
MIILFISILIIISILSLIVTPNPIYSIVFLILIFLLVNCIFLLLNLDFLALMMIIVYVGAIAILFLFIVMMINIKILETSFLNVKKQIPLGILLVIILTIQLLSIIINLFNKDSLFTTIQEYNKLNIFQYYNLYYSTNNFKILGVLIYNYLFLFLLLASIVLLLAMVAAISLTWKQKPVLRQQVYVQLIRTIEIANTRRPMIDTGIWLFLSWRKLKNKHIIDHAYNECITRYPNYYQINEYKLFSKGFF